MCVVAAAKAGEGVQSCVSGGGSRRVTPGGGGASRAGWQQRESGQAAAHAAQSPGAAAQGPHAAPRFAPSYFGGRWETAGGPLGNCRRTAPCGWGGLRACGPESLGTLFLRLLCALSGQSLEISEES